MTQRVEDGTSYTQTFDRAISEKKPRIGDFFPRPRHDEDGLSFFETKNAALANTKPYAAAYDSAEMMAAGYTLDYNGGQPVPGSPGALYPDEHVSVGKAVAEEWTAWVDRTDRRYVKWPTENSQRVEAR